MAQPGSVGCQPCHPTAAVALLYLSCMKFLIVINDASYGSERAYNALRLGMTLQREHADTLVRIFLLGDAVTCALPNQSTPQGYYNLERMVRAIIKAGGEVRACGS